MDQQQQPQQQPLTTAQGPSISDSLTSSFSKMKNWFFGDPSAQGTSSAPQPSANPTPPSTGGRRKKKGTKRSKKTAKKTKRSKK